MLYVRFSGERGDGLRYWRCIWSFEIRGGGGSSIKFSYDKMVVSVMVVVKLKIL